MHVLQRRCPVLQSSGTFSKGQQLREQDQKEGEACAQEVTRRLASARWQQVMAMLTLPSGGNAYSIHLSHTCSIGLTTCRDRLIGLLTERATRTLLYYLTETNQHVYHWLIVYIRDNPIPRVCTPVAAPILLCSNVSNASTTAFMDDLYLLS